MIKLICTAILILSSIHMQSNAAAVIEEASAGLSGRSLVVDTATAATINKALTEGDVVLSRGSVIIESSLNTPKGRSLLISASEGNATVKAPINVGGKLLFHVGNGKTVNFMPRGKFVIGEEGYLLLSIPGDSTLTKENIVFEGDQEKVHITRRIENQESMFDEENTPSSAMFSLISDVTVIPDGKTSEK